MISLDFRGQSCKKCGEPLRVPGRDWERINVLEGVTRKERVDPDTFIEGECLVWVIRHLGKCGAEFEFIHTMDPVRFLPATPPRSILL